MPAAGHGGGGFSGRRGRARRGRWIRRRDLREEAGGRRGRDDEGRDVGGDADVVHDGVGGREALLPRRHRAARRRWQRVDRDVGLPHAQVAGQAAAQAALARARHGHRRRVGVPGPQPILSFFCCILRMIRQRPITLVEWKSPQAPNFVFTYAQAISNGLDGKTV